MSDNALSFSNKDAILIVAPEKSKAILDMLVAKDYQAFYLNGMEIKSKDELLRRLSQVMKFPDYFGSNWDALEECLNDLSWLPARGYAIQFVNADNFINNSLSDFKVFAQIVESVSNRWKVDEVGFILIVETSNPNIMPQ